jgi:regulator of cell morphogenesis and NO signaling
MPLPDIINTYPEIVDVLLANNIEIDEHQHTSLAQLLKSKCLSRTEFLNGVQQALIESVSAQYKKVDAPTLADEIVKRFHEPHRAQMADLIKAARYIEKKYLESDGCPHGLTTLLVDFLNDLASHMDQEELFLFPALTSQGNFNLFAQLAVTHHSHDRHINMMAKLKSITNNFTCPSDASVQWQELYENLMEFILQLNMHIAIENQFMSSD